MDGLWHIASTRYGIPQLFLGERRFKGFFYLAASAICFALTELVARKLEKDINDAKISLRWMNKINRIFANYDRFPKQCQYE